MVYESWFNSLLKIMSKLDPILRFEMYPAAKLNPRCAGRVFDKIILLYLGPTFPHKVFNQPIDHQGLSDTFD